MTQNLGLALDDLKDIPDGELFIFPGTKAPTDIKNQTLENSNGMLEGNGTYSYHFSKQKALEVPGGSVKILDPETFPIAKSVSTALVTIKPGAMREIHWHPTSDEWTFFLYGKARATLFEASQSGMFPPVILLMRALTDDTSKHLRLWPRGCRLLPTIKHALHPEYW